MNVIIDIDDYILDTDIDSDWVNVCNDELAESLINAIPLSDVLQEIRQEIAQIKATEIYSTIDLKDMVLEILDKHIKGKVDV
jgi:hypothetical protein